MKTAIASLFFIFSVSVPTLASTEGASGKSLEGYDTMDMNQFKDLNRQAATAGSKFRAQCTNRAGEVIAATDTRFSECMNENVLEMRQRKGNDQQKQIPGQPNQPSVGFSTDL